jgi:hypothetical protein
MGNDGGNGTPRRGVGKIAMTVHGSAANGNEQRSHPDLVASVGDGGNIQILQGSGIKYGAC